MSAKLAAMTSDAPFKIALQVAREGDWAGGARVRLLRAIREEGSISAAARTVGISFRAAWTAVQAMNNLFAQPVVLAQTGGAQGGGALVTPAGDALIDRFEALERALSRHMADLSRDLGELKDTAGPLLGWSFALKTSARNALRGVVDSVTDGAVNAEVVLRISPTVAITAIITRESVAELELAPGRDAIALIKSSFVILAPGDESLRTSARNQLQGVVIRHETGAVNDEVVLELDAGKTLTATVTRMSGESLGLAVGDRAQALIKASHVILAVD